MVIISNWRIGARAQFACAGSFCAIVYVCSAFDTRVGRVGSKLTSWWAWWLAHDLHAARMPHYFFFTLFVCVCVVWRAACRIIYIIV